MQAREQAGKEASPTTGVVDSQSVKSAERGGKSPDPVGYDAGKKVKGRKRHAVVDTLGLMLGVDVLPANIQDRDGCLPVLKEVRRLFPFLQRIVADGGYQGANTAAAVRQAAGAPLEIVKRPDAAKGFVTLPKRWIVERTFGWLNRCRRLARDVEHRSRTHLAFVQIAMIPGRPMGGATNDEPNSQGHFYQDRRSAPCCRGARGFKRLRIVTRKNKLGNRPSLSNLCVHPQEARAVYTAIDAQNTRVWPMAATCRQYLTEHEAASHLRISIRSMQRWRQEGVGPRFHKAGRRVLYTVEDLENWLGAGARTSTSELPGAS